MVYCWTAYSSPWYIVRPVRRRVNPYQAMYMHNLQARAGAMTREQIRQGDMDPEDLGEDADFAELMEVPPGGEANRQLLLMQMLHYGGNLRDVLAAERRQRRMRRRY